MPDEKLQRGPLVRRRCGRKVIPYPPIITELKFRSENIKFNYTCFDRVIIRGYILKFFSLACVVLFLRAMGFSRKSNGIMRIFTDQLNSHISNQVVREIDGKLIQERIDYWMNLFFKFDKGKYATRSKHLKHDWYLTQVEERKLFDPDRDHHQQPQVAGASKTCSLFTGMSVDRPRMQ